MTALLRSMEVRERRPHGGGLTPVVAGELHTPAVGGVLTATVCGVCLSICYFLVAASFIQMLKKVLFTHGLSNKE